MDTQAPKTTGVTLKDLEKEQKTKSPLAPLPSPIPPAAAASTSASNCPRAAANAAARDAPTPPLSAQRSPFGNLAGGSSSSFSAYSAPPPAPPSHCPSHLSASHDSGMRAANSGRALAGSAMKWLTRAGHPYVSCGQRGPRPGHRLPGRARSRLSRRASSAVAGCLGL